MDDNKIQQDVEFLKSLKSFEPNEIFVNLEVPLPQIRRYATTLFGNAEALMQSTLLQIKTENLSLLEYSCFRLKSIFTKLGLQRLSIIFERVYNQLEEGDVDCVLYLLKLAKTEMNNVKSEFEGYLQRAISLNGTVPIA